MATHSQPSASFSDEQRFLFDLNGFIVIRGVLSDEEISALNAGVDSHVSEGRARDKDSLKNATSHEGMGAPQSRVDLGGMLGWDGPHGAAFRSLLAHPKLTPYLTALLGDGYRLDHQPLVIIQDKESEGFDLHGGPLTSKGQFNPILQYRCINGTLWNSLLAMSVCLCETESGDGGFCVVRGSHKSNFPVPADFSAGLSDAFREHIHQPATHPGDVILFSEATVHGALPWTPERQRRLALFRFAPHNFAYGRAYTMDWGEGVLDKCDATQKAVLLPPYALRLERPAVTADGSLSTYERSKDKLTHDQQVFGTKYF